MAGTPPATPGLGIAQDMEWEEVCKLETKGTNLVMSTLKIALCFRCQLSHTLSNVSLDLVQGFPNVISSTHARGFCPVLLTCTLTFFFDSLLPHPFFWFV